MRSLCCFFLFLPHILTAQNVGIGIASPTKGKLEVYGAVGKTSAIFGGDGGGISFQRNSPAIGYNQYFTDQNRLISNGNGFVQWLNMTNGSLNFDNFATGNANAIASAQTRRLTIQPNGNVALNAVETDASLYVAYPFSGVAAARIRGTQYNSVINDGLFNGTEHTYINGGKDGSDVYINDLPGGDVYIGGGTTKIGVNNGAPTAVLDIKQNGVYGMVLVAPALGYSNWEFSVYKNLTDPASDMYTFYNGVYKGNFFYLDGNYYKASDRRLKTAIQVLPSELEQVMALRPVSFEMKYDNPAKIKSIGFVAQEVQPLFPELIQVLKDDNLGYKDLKELYSMNYEGLGPVAIKAIQEQQQKIKQLQARNEALRHRITLAEKLLLIK